MMLTLSTASMKNALSSTQSTSISAPTRREILIRTFATLWTTPNSTKVTHLHRQLILLLHRTPSLLFLRRSQSPKPSKRRRQTTSAKPFSPPRGRLGRYSSKGRIMCFSVTTSRYRSSNRYSSPKNFFLGFCSLRITRNSKVNPTT